jgi:hypothetical protein
VRCCCRFDGSSRHPGCGAHVVADTVARLREANGGHDFHNIDDSGYRFCTACRKYYPNFSQDPCPYWDNR